MRTRKMRAGLWTLSRRFAAALLVALIFSVAAHGQYFSSWSPVANLGPTVNSISGDACPTITKDGLRLYFRSDRAGGYGSWDIYVSRRDSVSGPWGPPVNLGPTVNGTSGEYCTTFSTDGHWMYFVSDRPGCGGQDLYVSYREDVKNDLAWGVPKNLGCTVNSPLAENGPAYFEDPATGKKMLYYSSARDGGAGVTDIYVSQIVSGDALEPPAAVHELNTASSDYQPVLSRDGLEIVFVSNRPGGAGDMDLWSAKRSSTLLPWSQPTNLGPLINGPATEWHPTLSDDGATLIFASNRVGGIGAGYDADLYLATRTPMSTPPRPIGGPPISGGSGTTPVFDYASLNASPFPSDAFTTPDAGQRTGVRINLPSPSCSSEPTTCAEVELINQLDGFSVNPRIRVSFPGPVDWNTLRAGIHVVWLNDLYYDEAGMRPAGHITSLNQVLYDPSTNTAYAKPNEILAQHRRYAIVVTDAVRDRAGLPVAASQSFRDCVTQTEGYCGQLGQALTQVAPLFAPQNIVSASIFTTLSVTVWLERARDLLEKTAPGLQMATPKSTFKIQDLASITTKPQTKAIPPEFGSTPVQLHLLEGVGRVAFGSYLSPNFLNDERIIPAAPTARAIQLPEKSDRIHFNVYLPDSPAPAGGYPVVIAPGNAGGSRFVHSTSYASKFAQHGMATIAIDAVGKGMGPDGIVSIMEESGSTVELPLGGRGVDVNRDNTFASEEGCVIGVAPTGTLRPYPVYDRDCNRQTAVDLLQLVRAIKAGIDVDGDGKADLDASRIYYHGLSMGAMYGPVFVAISKDVKTAVFDSGGSRVDTMRWNRTVGPIRDRVPSLLNKGTTYDEDYVLRDQPVEIIDVPGAVAIQEVFERLEWLQLPGDPTAYATHLWTSTLWGVPLKQVLFQYPKGDTVVPNPAETALARAVNQCDRRMFYRHDLSRKLFPKLNPAGHYYSMPDLSLFPALTTDAMAQYIIAALAQDQAAGFLSSGGSVVPDVNIFSRLWFGIDLFETPPKVLTEELNR